MLETADGTRSYMAVCNYLILIKKWKKNFLILGVIKRNPLFLHEIEWKNNGFLFTTSNTIKK